MILQRVRSVVLAAAAALIGACGPGEPAAPSQLLLASTTSTEDSGLFEALIPAFEAAHPEYAVQVIAVGTGHALALGRSDDADVLLVHAPPAESVFVAEGYGLERREVMYNDFVVVGPPSDPAGIGGVSDAAEALRRIAAAGAPFVSRGDDSGTHRRERSLWEAAGVAPAGEWYLEAGQGMGEVLWIASEERAYTLADRGTYLFLDRPLELEVLVEGDERLFNQYAVILVAGARNDVGAAAFADWITSAEGQELIGGYGVERFGRPLFLPNGRQRSAFGDRRSAARDVASSGAADGATPDR